MSAATFLYDRAAFFSAIRPFFGGRLTNAQVGGMEAIFRARDLYFHTMSTNQFAYVLATARHEVGSAMQPVRETFATSDAQAIARLETAWKQGKLPWVKTPYWRRDKDGKAWFGRGYPQTTHKSNYEKAEKVTGLPLTDNPNLMLMPATAAHAMLHAMVHGTYRAGHSLDRYIPAEGKRDYLGARSIVNGFEGNGESDPMKTIARYAERFRAALVAAELRQHAAVPTPSPRPEPTPPPPATPSQETAPVVIPQPTFVGKNSKAIGAFMGSTLALMVIQFPALAEFLTADVQLHLVALGSIAGTWFASKNQE